MNRYSLLLAIVVLLSRVASAQPAPPPAPAPAPAPVPATPVPPVEPPPAETVPTEPAPVIAPAEAPKKDEKPSISAKYDGGIKLSADDGWYEMRISFRNQMRFESLRPLDDGGPDEFLSTFYIPRSRLAAEGHLFGEENRYKLELAMGDQGSFAFIKDMFIEKKLPLGDAWLRFGQWKRPFNRAEIVSDFASTLNERPFENEFVGGGRSQGISINNLYEKSPKYEWVVGMFNNFSGGSDRPRIETVCVEDPMTTVIDCETPRPINFPLDFQPALVARFGVNSPGMKGYSESDLEGGPLRWAFAGSYKIDLANFDGDLLSHGLEVDTMLKANGLAVEASVAMMIIEDGDPQFGFYVQPSFFITPKQLEVAARFGLNQEQEADEVTGTIFDRNLIEARGALNYYFHGHSLKVASDFGFFMLTGDEPASDDPDLQLRIMMQLLI